MSLLDMFGGASNPGALYGGLLTPQQNSALAYRGLLAAAGALGQAAMPSRLPVPMGAALGSAAGAMGSAQDEAALNAMRGTLLGLQGKELNAKIGMYNQAGEPMPPMYGGGGTGTPGGGGEVGSPAPNADLGGINPPIGNGTGGGENWETRHNNFAGMRIPGVIAGPNSGGFQAFDTPEAGVAAISHQLDRYASGATTGQPLTTLRQIISTWAPPSENDTAALISRATKVMGVGPDAPLDLSNSDTKAKLVEAMIRNEQGGNLPAAAAAAIPTVFNAPSFTPYGGKPKQIAQANTGTVSDVVPQPPGAPQGLLPPPQAPGSDTLRVGGAGGLLAPPQPTAAPYTNAPPVNGVGAPAPGPQGGLLAPQAPPVAPTASPAPAPSGAPGLGGINPAYIAAAQQRAHILATLGLPIPPDIAAAAALPFVGPKAGLESMAQVPAHNAETQFKTNEDIRAAFAKPGELRTNGLAYIPGTGQILARNPAVPEGYTVGGTATNPIAEPIPNALQGILNVEAAKKSGGYQAEFGAVPGVQFTGNAADLSTPSAPQTKPTPTAQGTQLPPISDQFMPQSPGELEHAIPAWQKKTDEWNAGIAPARQAEMRLGTIAQAFKLTETGMFSTHKAELAAALKSLGINPALVTSTDPSAVQQALHDNILTTLPLLKAATPRPSQIEFMSVSENREHPNLQPSANLRMLTEDLALVRQAQQLPADWNAAQQQGWRNPQSFETAWSRLNPLDATRDQVENEIGPLKGMPQPTAPGGPRHLIWNPQTKVLEPLQ